MVTTRRILNIGDPGDSTHFGTDDVDFINQLLTGTDQSSTASVDMATNWKFRSGRNRLANPANTFNYIVNTSAITADRNVYEPLLVADDTRLYQNAQQNAVGFDNYPSIQREGTFEPIGNNTATMTGILQGGTITGSTITSVYDTVEGLNLSCTSAAAANVNAGYVSPVVGIGVGRRLTNLRMKARVKVDSTTNCRLYMGFTSLTALPISDTPLGNTDSGFLLGFKSVDGNYNAYWNNAANPMFHFAYAPGKDANFHTFEIKCLANSDIIASVDGVAVTFVAATTALPPTTTNLYFNCVAQTTTTTARTLTVRYIEGEADR